MEVEADFKFHPIGQGCFYTGKIKISNSAGSLNFVYDCGTDSKISYLENEISNYKKELNNKPLDLLIISHFHEDHVNRVVQLLEGIECKQLVIPYYDPMERLLLCTATSAIDDYKLILTNPISFFSNRDRFKIGEIIIVGAPENDNNQSDVNDSESSHKKRLLENYENLSTDIRYENILDGKEKSIVIEKINTLEKNVLNFSKVEFLRKPYLLSSDIWEFKFYLKKHDNPILIRKFTNDVTTILENDDIELTDLFDSGRLKELTKIYKKHFGQDLNVTSLVLYHGPLCTVTFNNLSFSIGQYCVHTRCVPYCCYQCFHDDRIRCHQDDCHAVKLGTLLTGDIDISSQRKVEKIRTYFNGLMDKVCIFQVPHHGSKNNWPLIHPSGLESFCYYIVNHGLGRNKHPSPEVVDYIKINCANDSLYLNNEVDNFRYGFNICYFDNTASRAIT